MSLSIDRPHSVTNMNAGYIYASTLVKTKERKLLDETQLEMLITAKSKDELLLVLQDTYLAGYLSGRAAKSPSQAVEESVQSAKKLLEKIAPDPKLLEVLWIKYDFYNLRTIIKGRRAGLTDEEILENCFDLGLFDPEKMLSGYQNNTLYSLNERLSDTAKDTEKIETVEEIENIIQTHYFNTIREMSAECRNSFVKRYVELLIDLFNVKSRLRFMSRDTETTPPFISGGTFSESELENEEKLTSLFNRLGGENVWKDALADYTESDNFALLEKTSDEYIMDFLGQESFELFSLAPLFAYFIAIKNNAQTIRAITVGKNTGMSEHDIRFNLRRLYS